MPLYAHVAYPDAYAANSPGVGTGLDQPSWGAMKGGHPFWGREYREAWEDTVIDHFQTEEESN